MTYNVFSGTLNPTHFTLTLMVGHREEYLACKKLSDEVLVWLSVWGKMQMICI